MKARNKVIIDKTRCVESMNNKSRFVKKTHNKKLVEIILNLNLSVTNHYKTYWHIVWTANEIQKMLIQKC